jgi:hypothetical protein
LELQPLEPLTLRDDACPLFQEVGSLLELTGRLVGGVEDEIARSYGAEVPSDVQQLFFQGFHV